MKNEQDLMDHILNDDDALNPIQFTEAVDNLYCNEDYQLSVAKILYNIAQKSEVNQHPESVGFFLSHIFKDHNERTISLMQNEILYKIPEVIDCGAKERNPIRNRLMSLLGMPNASAKDCVVNVDPNLKQTHSTLC